jgi:hypothetical protein
MVQLTHTQREITLKLGDNKTALLGQTTNLQVIHQLLRAESQARLMALNTSPAVAIRREGVVEPLFALLNLTFRSLNKKHDFAGKFGLTKIPSLRNIFSQMDYDKLGGRLQSLPTNSDPALPLIAREDEDG